MRKVRAIDRKTRILQSFLPVFDFATIFEKIEIADRVLKDFEERYEDVSFDGAFLNLQPSAILETTEWASEVYESHCKEICQRYVHRSNLSIPTRAEVLCLLSKLSEVVPLRYNAGSLMELLFEYVIQGTDIDMQLKESSIAYDLDQILRSNKFRQGWRKYGQN